MTVSRNNSANTYDDHSTLLSMQVSTFQPINSLSYTLWMNDSMEVTSFREDNMTISYNTTDLRVYIQVPLIRWSDNTVTVTVSNECGEDATDEYELNCK